MLNELASSSYEQGPFINHTNGPVIVPKDLLSHLANLWNSVLMKPLDVLDFLIAYNINLNTTSVRRANSIAFDVREIGRDNSTSISLASNALRM